MPLIVNLRHLTSHSQVLTGELPVSELDLDTRDAMIQPGQPLGYTLEVEKVENNLLLRGQLRVALQCHCVRCLRPFVHQVALDHWTRHLALEGEDRVPVVNDGVDLTPYIREDILLEFPQHPLCDPECCGLEKTQIGRTETSSTGGADSSSTTWAELDKLKL